MKGNQALNKSDSDVSSALHVQMDSMSVEVKEAPKHVTIGKDNWRKFLLGTTISMMFVTLFIIADSVVYLVERDVFKQIFAYYSSIGNGFDILAYILFILSLLVPSVAPQIGRKAFVPLMVIIIGCYAYIPAFLIRWGMKERFNFSETLVLIYSVWISAVIGLFINVVSTKDKFNPMNGVMISAGVNTFLILIYVFVLEISSPYMFEIGLTIVAACGLAFYFNQDVLFMLNKRNDFYLNSDWFLGFIHLHTDIFFRFWIDIFKRDVDHIDTNLNEKSMVLNTGGSKSNLPPISEDNDENDDTEDIDRTRMTGQSNKIKP